MNKLCRACGTSACDTLPAASAGRRSRTFPALHIFTWLLLALLLPLQGALQQAHAESAIDKPFGYQAVGRSFKPDYPPWDDALSRNRAEPIFGLSLQLKGGKTPAALLQECAALSGKERLRYINKFWNRYPWIADIKNWGRRDYWAAPIQFVRKSGDCEDYAIAKYFTLRALGVPSKLMRIIVGERKTVHCGNKGYALLRENYAVFQKNKDNEHAVLAVEEGGEVYILDSLAESGAVISHRFLTDNILDSLAESGAVVCHRDMTVFEPHTSVNEQRTWMYVKGTKKTDLKQGKHAGSRK